MPAPITAAKTATAGKASDGGLYVVIGVGVCYATNTTPTEPGLGLHHRVIDLSDAEAARLLKLGVIRAADEDDLAREEAISARDAEAAVVALRGPDANPFGGRTVGGATLEAHAAEQIALAKKARG